MVGLFKCLLGSKENNKKGYISVKGQGVDKNKLEDI
jgi:hypothetical protein